LAGRRYDIKLTETAVASLETVRDRRHRFKLRERIDDLAVSPGLQGKALVGDLRGLRSVRAVGQRYRILYRVEEEAVVVYVVAVGLRKEGDRKDVYAWFARQEEARRRPR
jgi:mRNA interferase RelE/StbE